MNDVKLRARHFSFRLKDMRIKLTTWLEYYEIRRRKPHSDQDKEWLREFRAELMHKKFRVIVTHMPSRIKTTFDVPEIKRKELMKQVREKVQEARKGLKSISKLEKTFGGARYELIGGVMVDKQLINKIGKNLTIHDPTAKKTPRGKLTNYVGVELEFNQLANIGTGDIAKLLKNANLGKYVQVGIDPSCGFEVRVLLEEDNMEKPLKGIMNLLVQHGFTAEKNCGTHIHLDMRNRDFKQVYKNLVLTQTFLRKFLTKARKINKFCRINKYADYDHQYTLQKQTTRGDRYYGINTLSYDGHKTLEIRMHQGTLDFDVLFPYIKLLTKIANYQGALQKSVNTLKQAKAQYNLEPDLSAKLAKRIGSIFGRVLNIGVSNV